jgi:hypothetical protein
MWSMPHTPGRTSVFTTTEFDRWWEAQGLGAAVASGLDPSAARVLTWVAWRAGREQMSEATAHLRLQPSRR